MTLLRPQGGPRNTAIPPGPTMEMYRLGTCTRKEQLLSRSQRPHCPRDNGHLKKLTLGHQCAQREMQAEEFRGCSRGRRPKNDGCSCSQEVCVRQLWTGNSHVTITTNVHDVIVRNRAWYKGSIKFTGNVCDLDSHHPDHLMKGLAALIHPPPCRMLPLQ